MHISPPSNATGYWPKVIRIGILLCLLFCQSIPLPANAQSGVTSPLQAKLKAMSQTVEDHVARGASLLDEGNYDEAIAAFDEALGLDANHARAYALRGQAYWLKDELDQALSDLNRALELDPEDADAYGTRGAVYSDLGQYSEAISDYDESLRLDPDVTWTLAHRGYTHYLADDYEAALADLKKAIQLNPQYVWAIVARGATYKAMADYSKAQIDLTRAIGLDPDNDWALATRGSTYRSLGEYEKAIADLNHALELSPTYQWAQAERGRTYQEMGDYDAALADYNQVIEQDPTYTWALVQRGSIYYDTGQYDTALADFSQAVDVDPQYDWALAKRGQTYQALEAYDAALVDFTAAIELDPDYGWYYAIRADLLRIMERYDDALTDADQAVDLTPEDEFAWAVRGYVYRMMESYDDALADFSHAIELDPTYAWAYTMRGELYQLLERDEEALADFEEANSLQGGETVSESSTEAIPEPIVTAEPPVAIVAKIAIDDQAKVAQSPAAAQEAVIQIVAVGSFTNPAEEGASVHAGSGSGFIIDPSGIAVTNNHVVTGAALLEVYVDGYDEPLNARVLGVSECADLAVIDLEGDGFPYLTWYDGDITVGLDVYAAGYPLGDPEYTLTRGIIAKARANGQTSWSSLERVLQHDADINPGNSGGPLLTPQGQVVGVNYASNPEFRQSFAIGLVEAQPIIEQLRAGNDVDSLGINGEAISNGEDFSGIWVSSVKSGSPADQAGIQGGDFILTMESLRMAADGTMRTYCDVIRSHKIGDTLDIEFLRTTTNELCVGQINGRSLVCEPLPPPEPDDNTFSMQSVQHDSGRFSLSVPAVWTDRQSTAQGNYEGLVLRSKTDNTSAAITLYSSQGTPAKELNSALDEIHQKLQEDAAATIAACTYDQRGAITTAQFQGAFDHWSSCGESQNHLFTVVMLPKDNQAYYLYLIVLWNPAWDLAYFDQMLESLVVQQLATVVVRTNTLNVRTGPGTNYGLMGQVNGGARLSVVGQAANCTWLQVQLPDGRQGWVAGQAPYATLEGNCAAIPQGQISAAPVAGNSGGGGGSGGNGCILFQNHFNDEATVTLTSQDGKWNKTFKIGRKASYRECLPPGSYTYTVDVPPPWGSINGKLEISRGSTITFPIRGA